MPRVLFYIQRNLHLPFLKPIQEQICRLRPDYTTAFCAPPFIPPRNGLPGWGLEKEEVQRLSVKARFVRTVEEFQPDITVFADACTDVFNCGKRVFVGHGIISKGGFYTDNELVRRENLADLICVPGQWHKDILQKNVFSPIEVTGFIKSDRLFGPAACTRQDFCEQYQIPSAATIILYAPTFNAELSAIPCLGEQIALVCEPDRYLVIKLHTMTDVKLVELHRQLANTHPRIRYIEDIDVTPAMAAADILISDVSSVLVEFMALDRPVIAVNNPRQQEYEGYRPDDIEYRVRDACLQVSDIAGLLLAVDRSLCHPEALSAARRHYADTLCYGRDGRSAERAALAVLKLVEGGGAGDALCSRLGVIVEAGPTDTPASLGYDLGRLALAHPGVELEVIVRGMEPSPQLPLPMVRVWLSGAADLGTVLQAAAEHTTANFMVMLQTGLGLPHRLLQFLSHHFRWEPQLGLVRTLTQQDDYQQLVDLIYPEFGAVTPERAAVLFISTLMGRSVAMEYAAPGCCMFQRNDLSSLQIIQGEAGIPDAEQLRRAFARSNRPTLLALDLLVCAREPLIPDLSSLEQLTCRFAASTLDAEEANRLLALLVQFGCAADAALVWQQMSGSAVQTYQPLAAVWSGCAGPAVD
ncbi:MAG: hypothetical protein FIA89_11475 [Geobacter sp.]|nr:hypothetical protein [Geobacter sp.]